MAEVFAERYEIVREVGHGGFGSVYLAHDMRLRGRPVALKVLHPALSADPGVVRLFQEEAGVLASLIHEHIVPVYDAGVWENRRYIAMQFLEGRSLADVVKDEGAQPAARVRDWLWQAAAALAHAHEQGVLHRDVKSGNLMLNRGGDRLYMTDFGLAQAVQASGGSSVTLTGTLTGTAAYRAPEVAKTGHSVASDLYGLGVVAYELLAGRLPFVADDPLSMLLLHATEPVPPLPASVPQHLAALIMGLLAKDPAARPGSAAGLLPVLAGMTLRAGAPGPAPVEPAAAETEGIGRERAAEVAPAHGDEGEAERRPESDVVRIPETGGKPAGPGPRLRWLPVAFLAFLAVLAFVIWELTRQSQPPPAPIVAPLSLPSATPSPSPTQGIGSTWTSPVDGMVQVYVPAGEFLMGSADSDGDAAGDEKPQHMVTLAAYWIDRTEVTAAQYAQCVAAGRCAAPSCQGDGDEHPVACVTWQDAADYCGWADRRLPTEAEWEKAARGTDGRVYPWGNQGVAGDLLNYCDSSCVYSNLRDEAVNDGHFGTAPVGSYSKGASPYGALDMAGNVEEWVADWYDERSYAGSPGQNPQGPDSGQFRVLRGGSMEDPHWLARAVRRHWELPATWRFWIGFRCARPE